MRVDSPKFDGDYPERSVDCRIALRAALKECRQTTGLDLPGVADARAMLRKPATQAGWRDAEIKLALAQLARESQLRLVK